MKRFYLNPALLFILSVFLVGCGPSGEFGDPERFPMEEGGVIATHGNLSGNWVSSCEARSDVSFGTASVLRGIQFSQGQFTDVMILFSDFQCKTKAGSITSAGNYQLTTNGTLSKVKLNYSSRAIYLTTPEIAAIYNTNQVCGRSDWQKNFGIDVSRAACTTQLNQLPAFEVRIYPPEEDELTNEGKTRLTLRFCNFNEFGIETCRDQIFVKSVDLIEE